MTRPLLFVLGLAAACASPLRGGEGDRPDPPPAATAAPPAGYVIGLGDVLRVTVWKEPELTGDVTVRLDGMITVPLVGDVPAAGRAARASSRPASRPSCSASSRARASRSA